MASHSYWKSQAGHRVTAVDFSQAGLEKTLWLVAARAGSSAASRVNPVKADVLTWRPEGGPGRVDCVVLSFCHMPSAKRPAFMAGVVEMLRPGECRTYGTLHAAYTLTPVLTFMEPTCTMEFVWFASSEELQNWEFTRKAPCIFVELSLPRV